MKSGIDILDEIQNDELSSETSSPPQIRTCSCGHSWSLRRITRIYDSGQSMSYTDGSLWCPKCKGAANDSFNTEDNDLYQEIVKFKKQGFSDDQIIVMEILSKNHTQQLIEACLKELSTEKEK